MQIENFTDEEHPVKLDHSISSSCLQEECTLQFEDEGTSYGSAQNDILQSQHGQSKVGVEKYQDALGSTSSPNHDTMENNSPSSCAADAAIGSSQEYNQFKQIAQEASCPLVYTPRNQLTQYFPPFYPPQLPHKIHNIPTSQVYAKSFTAYPIEQHPNKLLYNYPHSSQQHFVNNKTTYSHSLPPWTKYYASVSPNSEYYKSYFGARILNREHPAYSDYVQKNHSNFIPQPQLHTTWKKYYSARNIGGIPIKESLIPSTYSAIKGDHSFTSRNSYGPVYSKPATFPHFVLKNDQQHSVYEQDPQSEQKKALFKPFISSIDQHFDISLKDIVPWVFGFFKSCCMLEGSHVPPNRSSNHFRIQNVCLECGQILSEKPLFDQFLQPWTATSGYYNSKSPPRPTFEGYDDWEFDCSKTDYTKKNDSRIKLPQFDLSPPRRFKKLPAPKSTKILSRENKRHQFETDDTGRIVLPTFV